MIPIFFDPIYLLYLAPGVGLAIWAQSRIHSAYRAGSRVPGSSGASGAEAAAAVLRDAGVHGVRIEQVTGDLSDYYDPRAKVLRLSGGVFAGRSVAALGVAAHEAAHAIQGDRHSRGLPLRSLSVPVAGIGSTVFWMFLLAGLLLTLYQLVLAGIAVLSLNVALQLATLPVEYDASRRARESLLSTGLISTGEEAALTRVLDAAALPHVAATFTSAPALLYDLVRVGLLGAERED